MSNSVNEILDADLLFIIGSNTTEAHPIIGNKMKQAMLKGTKAIVIDPRRTEIARLADIHLQIEPGTDAAFVNGLMHIILEEGWQDEEYINDRVTGFDEIKEVVKNYTPESVSKLTGISVEEMYTVAEMYAKTKKAGIFYTLGITEHTNGTDNVINLSNLALLTGHVGVRSAGINPLRGQNNVQGACDMGALPGTYPGYPKVLDPNAIEFFEEKWGYEMPKTMGMKIPEMMDAAVEGDLKALMVMGEDIVLSDPDANHIKHALESLDFMVSIEIFMSETSKYADIIFPATSFAEKDGTFTASERRVQRIRKAVTPPGDAREEAWILRELANRMGYIRGFEWETAEDIFDDMRVVTPQYRGMTYDRIGNQGLNWPCPTTDHPGTETLHVEGTFNLEGGRAKMIPVEHTEPAERADEEYPYILNTGRKLGHYNLTTRFSDSLDELHPYETAEINPEDAKRLGLEELDFARVTSRRGSIVTRVTVTDKVMPGNLFMTHHYKESPVNELTNSAFDPVTLTGEYKISAVSVEKVEIDPSVAQMETGIRFVPLVDFVED